MERARFLLGTAGVALAHRVPARAPLRSRLAARVAAEAAASSGTLGLCVRRLVPGPPLVAYNATLSFPTASVIKVLILVTLMRRVERKPSLWHREIALREKELVAGSDVLADAQPGQHFTVEQLARAMIEQSDNSAANAIIDLVGFHAVAETARLAGMRDTQLERYFMDIRAIANHSDNRSTPRDLAQLLYLIAVGAHESVRTIAEPLTCRTMVEIMLQQKYRDKIPAGMPPGIPIANKTGEIDGVRNDIAIVDPFGNDPYVIAALTMHDADISAADEAIRRVARAVYDVLG